MNKSIYRQVADLIKNKIYLIILCLASVAAYGYEWFHIGIGMDDTAVKLYFDDGLAPYVGRWTVFLINKLLFGALSKASPIITDFLGVVILALAATLWCALWKSKIGNKYVLPGYVFGLIAAIFVTCPIISEVYIYQLHNGICMGYALVAIALYHSDRLVCSSSNDSAKGKIKDFVCAITALTVATGCYESFMLVYVLGAITLFIFKILCEEGSREARNRGFILWLFVGTGEIVLSIAARALILNLVKCLYNADSFASYDVLYRHVFGDNLSSASEFGMTLKRFISMYYLNALFYLPITILAFSRLTILVFALYISGKKRTIYPILCIFVMFGLPAFMAEVEGTVTKYRSAQYILVTVAFAMLILSIMVSRLPKKANVILCGFMTLLVLAQCVDINRWFYVDYEKYVDAREGIYNIADDLNNGYDTSKPVIFVGAYDVPKSVIRNIIIPFDSGRFRILCSVTDPIDVHWKEKYYNPLGYCFMETPQISILRWGCDAFNHTNGQIIEFLRMHGIDEFHTTDDREVIEKAREYGWNNDLPPAFEDGYITEFDDFILVNLDRKYY